MLAALALRSFSSALEEMPTLERIGTKPEIVQGIGQTEFAVTCHEPLCQRYFSQGLAWLHGGDLRQAERSFREAALIEPGCAMAWWGMGMASAENRVMAARYCERAQDLCTSAMNRERMWITALSDYLNDATSEVDRRTFMVQTLDRIATAYPDDIEAKAFLVRQVLDNRAAGMSLPLTSGVDAMLSELLRTHPQHPAHRYRLQLWMEDAPERALSSAAAIEKTLPSLPLALTEAARLYSRLKRDADSLRCYQASVVATQARLRDGTVLPFEVTGYVENTNLLAQQWIQAGQLGEALALARQLIEVTTPVISAEEKKPEAKSPRGGEHGHIVSIQKAAESPATLGQRLLIEALVDFQQWEELTKAAKSGYLESSSPEIQARRIHALGLAHFVASESAALAKDLDDLLQLAQLRPSAATAPDQRESQRLAGVFAAELEACASILADSATNPSETIQNPAIPSERKAAFRLRLGDLAGAESYARQALEVSPGVLAAELGLLRVLAAAHSNEAATCMAGVLKRFPKIDRRLLPASLSAPALVADQGGETTALVSWKPQPPPKLPFLDRNGQAVPMAKFHGKPVVLVFYLGAGCVHCVEQLRAFVPLEKEYLQAGITILAVGTDSVAALQETQSAMGSGDSAPFMLVSDDKLLAFHAIGAFDGLNHKPLHATLLIDGEGRVRWRNISTGPFMGTRSLLEEAKRLAALDAGRPITANNSSARTSEGN